MKIILESMMGSTKLVELTDDRSQVGYQVIADEEGFFNPSSGVAIFVESPRQGTHPWVAYVRKNEDGSFDFDSATRMPLEKTTIHRVLS